MTAASLEQTLSEIGWVPHPKGPVTRARQRRTAIVYASLVAVGLAPALAGMDAGWQAAGLGLWMPGTGFLAAGGWALVLFPLTLLLFAASLIAWFWAGMVVAPVLVWVGSAGLAGWMADDPAGPIAYGAAGLAVLGTAVLFRRRNARAFEQDETRYAARARFLPQSLAEVRENIDRPADTASRELDREQLASLRYVLDRSLQPVESWNGFTILDQFQPAALRYQLNHMGFALGVAQGSYLPSFRGYLAQAQRNLIEKYLLRRVWSYWVLESCWGHLNFRNFDPADRDNIMLTGWFGMQVGQYMLNSGDRRYAEPGALTFRLSERTAYPHDLHSVVGSIVENLDRCEFTLYPCEPNWIYPICNHYGMSALAVHDALFQTTYVDDHLPKWLDMLDAEFTRPSGSLIGLRSKHTGLEVPFSVTESGYAIFANVFVPERARRMWAIARREIAALVREDADGGPTLVLPGRPIDAGHYRPGSSYALGGLLLGAREFGDDDLAAAIERGLASRGVLESQDGVNRYVDASNLGNATIALGHLMRSGDFRRSFTEGPPEATLRGPVLGDALYPDVLVAKAFGNGEDLDLVLYPGAGGGGAQQSIRIDGLQPGRTYVVRGASPSEFRADGSGSTTLDVLLSGRTAISIAPTAA